jgi:hypothetical protein
MLIDLYINVVETHNWIPFWEMCVQLPVLILVMGACMAPIFQSLDLMFQGRLVTLPTETDEWENEMVGVIQSLLENVDLLFGNPDNLAEYLASMQPEHPIPLVDWLVEDPTDMVQPANLQPQAVAEHIQANLADESEELEHQAQVQAQYLRLFHQIKSEIALQRLYTQVHDGYLGTGTFNEYMRR